MFSVYNGHFNMKLIVQLFEHVSHLRPCEQGHISPCKNLKICFHCIPKTFENVTGAAFLNPLNGLSTPGVYTPCYHVYSCTCKSKTNEYK